MSESGKERRALVTGANGFMGSHLVDSLIARSRPVRCLVRPGSDLRWLDPTRCDLALGRITEPDTLDEAFMGVGTVYHVAGLTLGREREYEAVNVRGTENVVRAAERAGVERIVLVSSLAAAGPNHIGSPRTEDDPPRPTNRYGKSKLRGERIVEASAVPWTIVRPPAVYGPRDSAFLRMFRMVARGPVPRVRGNEQKISIIHVTDLVEGIIRAGENGDSAGHVYFLTHPTVVSWDDIGNSIGRALGHEYKTFSVPRWVLPVVSGVAGLWAGIRNRPNPYPHDRLRDLRASEWTCSGERAREELGFTPRMGLDEGISLVAEWYRSVSWLST